MPHDTVLRPFHGVKLKLAKEFTGFTGPDKKFRELAKEVAGDLLPPTEDVSSTTAQKTYKAEEIRRIRQKILPNLVAAMLRELPPVMNFRMSKGGTGKTTVSANVGACLAQMGYKALLIDGDPQGSLSKQLGFNINVPSLTHIGTILERLSKGAPTRINEAVVSVYSGGMLDLIPANITLADDAWMASSMSRETLFLRLLEKESAFFKRYDVVIIDSAPGTSIMMNTLIAASKIITAVVTPEAQSILALDVLRSNLAEINATVRRGGPEVGLHIIANRYRQSYRSHNDALEKLGTDFAPYLNDTIIRDFAGFLRETDMEDVSMSAPVLEKEPNSVGARDIIDVTKALIKLYNVRVSADQPMEGQLAL